MVTVKDKDCNYIEVLAMLDSASNTSFISKNVAKKLGIRGYKTHLTMNLTGGQKKSEESELIDLAVSSTLEQSVQKSIQAYAINKPCLSAKTVSRTADWLKGPEFLRKPEEEWPAFKESSPNNAEKRSSDMKCVQVTATETSDEFVQDSVGQTQAVENPIMEHEIVLNVQKSQESHGICFEVYQQRKNKSKKSRHNITERVITSRTLAIQIEPTNPRQR